MTALSSFRPAYAQDRIEAGPLAVLQQALQGVTQTLKPDQHVIMEASERRTIIGVVSGMLRSFRVTPDGRRHITRFVDAGGVIGLGKLAAFRASAEAVTRSAIVTFSAKALEAAMATDPAVREAVLDALTKELIQRDRIQFRLGRLWSDERVADFLLERAGARGRTGAVVALEMSRADIADHLGVTFETVSRAISRFQRAGMIAMTDAHHFTILHHGALTVLAEGDGGHAIQHAHPCEAAS